MPADFCKHGVEFDACQFNVSYYLSKRQRVFVLLWRTGFYHGVSASVQAFEPFIDGSVTLRTIWRTSLMACSET